MSNQDSLLLVPSYDQVNQSVFRIASSGVHRVQSVVGAESAFASESYFGCETIPNCITDLSVAAQFVGHNPEYTRMNTDRRSHIRVNLRLQLFLVSSGASIALRTETENVSMDGFFFHSERVFPPGEYLHFLLLLPDAAGAMQSARVMCLKGAVEVVRVTASAAGPGFGIGCRMNNYRVLLNPDLSSDEQILAALRNEGDSGSPRANSSLKYLIPLH